MTTPVTTDRPRNTHPHRRTGAVVAVVAVVLVALVAGLWLGPAVVGSLSSAGPGPGVDEIRAAPELGLSQVTGTGQTTSVGNPFVQPVVAHSVNPGTSVTFSLYGNQDGLTATGTFPGGQQSVTVVGDAAGNATSPLIRAGAQTGQLLVVVSLGSETFNSQFTVTDAAGLSDVIGTGQTTTAGAAFPNPVVVRSAVPGTAVTFSLYGAQDGLTATGSFPGGPTAVTVVTDRNGNGTSPVITAGPQTGQLLVVISSGTVEINTQFTVNPAR